MISESLVSELEKITEPGALVAELAKRFPGKVGVALSGQVSDCALVDMAVKTGAKVRLYTVDTLRVFPETLELFDALEKKYPGIKIERLTPDPKDVEPMVKNNGEFLFFDSKEKQELCCRVRKVFPNQKMLDQLDAWVTGLRSDQSPNRAKVARLESMLHPQKGSKENMRQMLKVNPLADWPEAKVREYLKANQVPVHKLLEAKLPGGYYYESLGCVICTTPISPYEARRAGRWRWFNSEDEKKECGLHLPENS